MVLKPWIYVAASGLPSREKVYKWIKDLIIQPLVILWSTENSLYLSLDHPEAWGSGDPAYDWKKAAEETAKRIQAINPNILIIIGGIGYGINLSPAASAPIQIPNQVTFCWIILPEIF